MENTSEPVVPTRKPKIRATGNAKPLKLYPLEFKNVVAGLLRVKPEPREPKKKTAPLAKD
jgi:hypothetical protein